jgi:hypothetical protein
MRIVDPKLTMRIVDPKLIRKNIVLIDFTLSGHHLSFLRDFSSVLIQDGHHVFALVPEASKLEAYMKLHLKEKACLFKAVEFNEFVFDRSGTPLTLAVNQLRRWRHEAQQIRNIEKKFALKVDLVFYAWLDNQFGRFTRPRLLDKAFPYKWSGLYFHPYHLRLEKNIIYQKVSWKDCDGILLSKNCIGVAVHDQAIIHDFSKRVNKPVFHFPETADDSFPDYTLPLYRELKQKAAGRLIVGMIGCEASKGTMTLLRTAKMADPESYYFAFLGILPRNSFSENDWQELQSFIASKPENAYFKFESIPEGSAYNAVFDAFDIPFLVYDKFISSSNRLTKAAIFKKLVLASNNYCVGDDVRKYNLGIAVPPKNPEAALDALKVLSNKIKAKDFPYQHWEEYRELNSIPKLKERFIEILNHL